MLQRPNRTNVISWLLLMGVTAAIFLPMLLHWRNTGDVEPHLHYVERMLAGEPGILYEVPNFLWHALVAGFRLVFPGMALNAAGVAASLCLYWFLAAVLFWLIRQVLPPDAWWTQPLAVCLTIALMLPAPIFLLTPANTYFGYLAPYVYHNPTMLPLRPVSLLLFVMAAGIFSSRRGADGDERENAILEVNSKQNPLQPPPPHLATSAHSGEAFSPLRLERGKGVRLQVIAAAVLTLASILAKPSFVMILLPALAVMTLVNLLRRAQIDWWMLIFGIGIPAVGLLGFQALTYSEGGIAWYPLHTFDLWTLHYNPAANQHLFPKFVLSILFPLFVYIFYVQQARRDIVFNLGWLCFAAGAGYTYLLIDTGEPPAGNLTWNGQIGVFVLMVAAALFWLRQTPRSGRFWLCGLVLALHVISGVVWYLIHIDALWPNVIYTAW